MCHYYVHLDAMARVNLAWWDCFLIDWHGGASFIPVDNNPSVCVFSDASGSFGCGAICTDSQWFQICWPPTWAKIDIAAKKIVPVVAVVAVWGRGWCQHQVTFHSDNAAVVSVIQRRSAKDPLLLHLLRCLYFYAAYYQFSYCACHVPGVDNVTADALSRNNVTFFFSHSAGNPNTAILGSIGFPHFSSTLLVVTRLDHCSELLYEVHCPSYTTVT